MQPVREIGHAQTRLTAQSRPGRSGSEDPEGDANTATLSPLPRVESRHGGAKSIKLSSSVSALFDVTPRPRRIGGGDWLVGDPMDKDPADSSGFLGDPCRAFSGLWTSHLNCLLAGRDDLIVVAMGHWLLTTSAEIWRSSRPT